MREKILLTGATGFLGSHLLKRLLENGYEVVILVRETSQLERIKSLMGFEIFVINKELSNLDELFDLFSIHTIIHVATEYGKRSTYSEVLFSNVYFPVKLLEAALQKDLKAFINTDSFFSKFPEYPYMQEYISTKRIFKDFTKSLSRIKIINMQLEHVYGENDSKDKFIPYIIEKMILNENNIELTEGSQKRDFIYVEDVVEAYLIALKNIYNFNQFTEFEVGSGNSISIKDFLNGIHEYLCSESNLLFGALPNRVNEIMDSKANNKSLLELGWMPQQDAKINKNTFLNSNIIS
jgi:nucleoside-diphosphate-sugar epimerase